ncbi:hypothetical protein FIV42_16460 [Persicimonas caeni]|uniref:Uncharacterized protein n=1 Tax=Persicimonas caeni TaxID=2292766 RepID=A0A4Y6PVB9_PERCE|nr:hypothetical protein [Persicimonas caeni]QDG52272.1 hypothetical protein FIV42_16460 [Persicimonas caeni]QED33494.1 hypothetical protein FRD00_16455 [Persicimonas caeni]
MALLDSATAKINGLAKSGGEKMLEGLLGLLSMSDWDLGYNFGKLVGMILLEVILIIVSMGGWGAVTAAKPFIKLAAKLLNKVDDVVLVIQKAFRPAKGLLMRGLDGAADFLSNIPGLGPIFARVQRAFKAREGRYHLRWVAISVQLARFAITASTSVRASRTTNAGESSTGISRRERRLPASEMRSVGEKRPSWSAWVTSSDSNWWLWMSARSSVRFCGICNASTVFQEDYVTAHESCGRQAIFA